MIAEIERWRERTATAIEVLSDIQARVAAPPKSGAPQERLVALLDIWRMFDPPSQEPDPSRHCAQRWATRVAGTNAHDNLFDALCASLLDIERGIANALDAGAESDLLIRTDDFRDVRQYDSGYLDMATMQPVMFAVGIVASLPAKHRIRNLLTSEAMLHYGGLESEAALVLGPMNLRNGLPRNWYYASEAITLTLSVRKRQLRKSDEEAEERSREEEKRKRQFWDSPLGQLHKQQTALADLESRGQIPDEPLAEPAVRVNGR